VVAAPRPRRSAPAGDASPPIAPDRPRRPGDAAVAREVGRADRDVRGHGVRRPDRTRMVGSVTHRVPGARRHDRRGDGAVLAGAHQPHVPGRGPGPGARVLVNRRRRGAGVRSHGRRAAHRGVRLAGHLLVPGTGPRSDRRLVVPRVAGDATVGARTFRRAGPGGTRRGDRRPVDRNRSGLGLGSHQSLGAGLLAARPDGAVDLRPDRATGPHPLIQLDWFANPAFSVPVASGFFVQFSYMDGFTLAPKLLAEVRSSQPTPWRS